mmetsp:Transcript_22322/g.41622  ORF Transcript_22322/g.41622 Transcript_22322/m.41622 type:complete len:235 (-) Transcript_22322:216-920(-)
MVPKRSNWSRSNSYMATSVRTCLANRSAALRFLLSNSSSVFAFGSHLGISSQSVSVNRCPHERQPLNMTGTLCVGHFGRISATESVMDICLIFSAISKGVTRKAPSEVHAVSSPLEPRMATLEHWPWCAFMSEQFWLISGPEQQAGHIFKSGKPASFIPESSPSVLEPSWERDCWMRRSAVLSKSASPSTAPAAPESTTAPQHVSSLLSLFTLGTHSGSLQPIAGHLLPASSAP